MKATKKAAILATLLSGLATAGTASAVEYRFRVNVDVKDLMPGVIPKVQCDVFGRASGTRPLAIGSERARAVNGNFRGVVTVRVNVLSGEPTWYRCRLYMMKGKGGYLANMSGAPSWARARPGTRVVNQLHGRL